MNKLLMALRYTGYYFSSHNAHHIHSPFVYQLYTQAICADKKQNVFKEIEKSRNHFLKCKDKITAFGSDGGITERTISEIAKNSLKRKRYARLLYRLVNHFKPELCLEIGTSLGISTLYIAAASEGKVITLEGNEAVLKYAQKQFLQKESANRIKPVHGLFDDTLPKVLEDVSPLDFVFFDGNHHCEPTLKYFNLCLGKIHSKSVFVFDDINWSKGMQEAWSKIKSHPKVTVSIDLFMMGIVFFDKDLSKQNFVLRY